MRLYLIKSDWTAFGDEDKTIKKKLIRHFVEHIRINQSILHFPKKHVPLQKVCTPCYICVALKGINKQDFKRGNVLLSAVSEQTLCSHLIVDVEILKTHSTTIKLGYQPIMHVQNLRTSVTIKKISNKICGRLSDGQNDEILRTGDSAQLYLELCFEKKFIKKNANILLCEGRTKVVGIVTEIFNLD